MKKYLLLRNNKQTGPHTFDELMEMGLKPHDLVWVEGKSASWRYPSEMDEFKTQATVLAEIPPERSFTPLQNEVLIFDQEPVNPLHPFEDELSEFPTLARFMEPNDRPDSNREKIVSTGIVPVPSGIADEKQPEQIPVPVSIISIAEEAAAPPLQPVPALVENIPAPAPEQEQIPQQKPVSPKRVFVTLPNAVSDHTRVVIHPKETVQIAAPVIEKAPEPSQVAASVVSPEPLQVAVSVESSEPLRVAASVVSPEPVKPNPVMVEHTAPPVRVIESTISNQATPISPLLYPATESSSGNLMQKLAVAAAIVSLLAVTVLIGNSIINPPDYTYQLPATKNTTGSVEQEQPLSTVNAINVSETKNDLPQNNTGNNVIIPDEKPISKPSQKNKNSTAAKEATNVAATDEPAIQKEAVVLKEATNTVNTDPKEETRKNISNLVHYQFTNYKVNAFGGVSDFEVTVSNGSSYPLDLVVVELQYIQSNKKVFKTEKLEFKGIAPQGKQTIGVAKTNRGIKVVPAITTISSRDLDLTYHN